jgi:hypothetical protein
VSYMTFARLSRWAGGIVTALALTTGAFGQETIEQRLDRLERDNAALKQQVNQQQQSAPAAGLSFEANTVAAQGGAPAYGPAPTGAPSTPKSDFVEVGSNLSMAASWKDGVYFSTPNKDFTAHIGGWAQYDNYWLSA